MPPQPRPPLRIALAQANATVGDVAANVQAARRIYAQVGAQADVVIFPELFLSGYLAGDLIEQPAFLGACADGLQTLAALTAGEGSGETSADIIIGAPRACAGKPRNSLFHLCAGKVAVHSDKATLFCDGVYDEKRNFSSGPLPGPLIVRGYRLGLMICRDLWEGEVVDCLAETGAEALVVMNGSVFSPAKGEERLSVATRAIAQTGLPLAYLNLVGGQDERLFDGASFALNADYGLAMRLDAFTEATGLLTLREGDAGGGLVFCDGEVARACDGEEALYRGATLGLRDYCRKSGFHDVIVGLSGGIDSALVAQIASDALGPERVSTFMLPFRHTSALSLEDARACAGVLGVRHEDIAIESAVDAFRSLLRHHLSSQARGETYENLQARVRGTVLMALANLRGALLLSTGNKSELAVGYATLYGDMNGAFNPLKDLYKTQVFALARWRGAQKDPASVGLLGVPGAIPPSILTKAPSAELREGQCDQDTLPPYDRLDAILEGLIEDDLSVAQVTARGFAHDEVVWVERRLRLSEFKRFQAPPGPKLSTRHLRLERRYPVARTPDAKPF